LKIRYHWITHLFIASNTSHWDWQIIFRFVAIILTLLLIQAVFGKKASFPYGIVAGLSPFTIGIVVILWDYGLMVIIRKLFNDKLKWKWLDKMRAKLFEDQNKMKQSKWTNIILNLGKSGVILIVALPFAGGVWSGAIISHIMKLSKTESYLLIGLGSTIGCAIFVLSFIGIVNWVI
jgi:uncharacterized membrane protein